MRLDRQKLAQTIELFTGGLPCRAYVERPFTGGPMFINTMLVARAFYEATLCCMEDSHIGVQTVDSREWQKPILGEIKGSPALKKASMLKGCQLYPQWAGALYAKSHRTGCICQHPSCSKTRRDGGARSTCQGAAHATTNQLTGTMTTETRQIGSHLPTSKAGSCHAANGSGSIAN
jgi:hypothetical protein